MSDSQFIALTQKGQEYLQQMNKGYNDSLAASIPNYRPPPMLKFQFNPDMFLKHTHVQTNETDETEKMKEGDDD